MKDYKFKGKSVMAWTMAFVLLVHLMQTMVSYGVNAQSPEEHIKNPGIVIGTEIHEGIQINKTAQDYKSGNFKVKLEVEIGESTVADTAQKDIILLIDRSGSMIGEKMENAKAAAKAFVDNLLVDGQDAIRIGVVSFAGDGSGNNASSKDHELSTNKESIKNAIDELNAVGATFMDKGFDDAVSLFHNSGRTNAKKIIILLADGRPTFAFDRLSGETDKDIQSTRYEVWHLAAKDFWKKGYNAMSDTNYWVDTKQRTGWIGTSTGSGTEGEIARNTIISANQLKKSGIEIISIGIHLASEQEEYFMESVASGGSYYNTAENATDLERILEVFREKMTDYKVRDGIIKDEVDIFSGVSFGGNTDEVEINVINKKTGDSVPHEIRVVSSDGLYFRNIQLRADEKLSITYPATLSEEAFDGEWKGVGKAVLIPTPDIAEGQYMAFPIPEVKDKKGDDSTQTEKTVKVQKSWLGEMPDRLEVELYQNDQKIEILTLEKPADEPAVWYGEFTNKVKSLDDSGNLYQYKIVEKIDEKVYSADSKEVELTEAGDNILLGVLVNRNIIRQDLTVKKVWAKTPEAEQIPVTVTLYRTTQFGQEPLPVPIDPVVLNKENGFTGVFDFMPVFDSVGENATGNRIIYSVREEADGEKYTVEYAGDGTEGNPFVITNTKKQEMPTIREIEVAKEWKGKIATQAALALYDVEAPDDTNKPVAVITLPTAQGAWTDTFTNLPSHRDNGEEIKYRVKEVLPRQDDTGYHILQNGEQFLLEGLKYQLTEKSENGKFIFTNTEVTVSETVLLPYIPSDSSDEKEEEVAESKIPQGSTTDKTKAEDKDKDKDAPKQSEEGSDTTNIPKEKPDNSQNPSDKEDVMEETEVPRDKPELPKTGGVRGEIFGLLGMRLLGLGEWIKKKKTN